MPNVCPSLNVSFGSCPSSTQSTTFSVSLSATRAIRASTSFLVSVTLLRRPRRVPGRAAWRRAPLRRSRPRGVVPEPEVPPVCWRWLARAPRQAVWPLSCHEVISRPSRYSLRPPGQARALRHRAPASICDRKVSTTPRRIAPASTAQRHRWHESPESRFPSIDIGVACLVHLSETSPVRLR